ncbi:MAG: tetratricopeptide repeat protein [Synechococcales cyanobacterium K44_A2020_017]|jgi:tetratricopeptide (TPR) repeat protein|uniref:tetratricopeptide repeat protein n=1 Tax=Leptolyngbya sp. CCY15150 TaxID=2767772 RepID=UPI001950AF9D|nr:tetratricopeptide repeat protein [Leptolyngbya sp. CCY15150]MBF2088939.1 tetratricopeptide repeat protein [Synechococcales cyanobacterium K32_A2020_035]MBF2093316.1 tetratricopeptide repeat protein [Synechococcales cyanobacterium K44_A2020_017]
MDERLLAVTYLSILVVLLLGGSWFLVRQVLRTRRVETSLSRLQEKLSNGKGTSQDYYELGGIFLDKRLYSQSIVQFQKALKCKDLKGAENIAVVYNALGFSYAAQEQYDLAIRQYKEALDQTPDYVTALNNLAYAYEKKQLIAQALETYAEALKYDPTNSIAKRRAESLSKRVTPSSAS